MNRLAKCWAPYLLFRHRTTHLKIMNLKSFLASLLLSAFISTGVSEQDASLPITVNVLGAVRTPSRCILPAGATVLDALASVGDATRSGNLVKVRIIRKSTPDKTETLVIDVKKILNGQSKNVLLRDGDTLFVPETIF